MIAESPLSILHVSPSYVPATAYGGPPQSVHALARGLVQAGHRVTVATTNMNGTKNLDVRLGAPVALDQVAVHYFPCTFRRLFWSMPLWRFVGKVADSFDVIHLHSVYLFPTNAAGWAARRSSTPYVVSPRGMLVPELVDGRSRWVKRGWLRLVERHNLRAAHLHFATLHERSGYRRMDLPCRQQCIIPNIVAGPGLRFQPTRDPRYLLYLGRPDPTKNLEQAVLALRDLPPDITLRIVGPDQRGHAHALRELAAAHQLSQRVQIEPAVGEDKWELLAGATAVILMSDSESFGNVVVEAACVGTPSIVSQGVGCAGEMVAAGAGLIAHPSPKSVARAVLSLREGPVTTARCLAFAKGFGPEVLVPRYVAMYRAALCS